MGKTAILAVRIVGDATDAVAALDKLDGSAKSMQATMDKAAGGSALALAAIGAAAMSAGNAASDLQQASGAVDSVFGEYADKIHKQAEGAADAVGLSASQYSNMSSVLGSQLKNMGVNLDAVGGQSQDLIGLGADLSAMFGGTTADAVGALSSLLRGERDPIERYGVSINQAAIDAQKAAMGLAGLTGEAEKNANLQATLALLTTQTAAAQGQFSRESDTAAGQQQRATAEWENASAALGEQLLPLMADAAGMLSEVARWVGENTPLVSALAGVIGVLAAGILIFVGAMKAYAAVQAIQTAAQIANNLAWLASPITWIVIAIVAAIALVIAIVVLLVQNWDQVRAVAEDVWSAIMAKIDEAGAWFSDVFDNIGAGWDFLVGAWTTGFETLVGWIKDALAWLAKLVDNAVPSWVKDLMGMEDMTVGATFAVAGPSGLPPANAMRSFAAPQAFAAASPVLSPASMSAARGAAVRGTGDTYVTNYTSNVSGAIDSDGTARAVRGVFKDHDARTGRAESRW